MALVLIWTFLTFLPGCSLGNDFARAKDAFLSDNPGASTIDIDDNEDNIVDSLAQDKNSDGLPDRDANGKIVEVQGARAAMDGLKQRIKNAEAIDYSVSEIITALGIGFGVPGLTAVGAIWGKRKPVKQLAETSLKLETVIKSIDDAKQGGSVDGIFSINKEILEGVQKTLPGLLEDIAAIRKKLEQAQ